MYWFHRWSLHFEWIDCTAILIEPEIEVWSGGQTAASHIPDDITLLYINTLPNTFAETTQVHVSGGINTVVFDFHIVATTALLIAYFGDDAIAHRMDGCSGGSRIVNSMMGTPDL